jgi:hypothetical protein
MSQFNVAPSLTPGLYVVVRNNGETTYMSLFGFGTGRKAKWVTNKESASHFREAEAVRWCDSLNLSLRRGQGDRHLYHQPNA